MTMYGKGRPEIVCLCGSRKFRREFEQETERLTTAGIIVLTIGSFHREHSKEVKTKLDELHYRKIDLADRVVVIDVDKYVGESTSNEIQYARRLNKPVEFISERV